MTVTLQSRVCGSVMGAVIGDALGHPTEFLNSLSEIQSKFGPEGVKGYELYWERDGRRFAPYPDDTQMAELVLRAFTWARIQRASLDRAMRRLSQSFVEWARHPQGGHRAPGKACLAGCYALANGIAWEVAGAQSAGGCGSVMRAFPAGIVFMDTPEKAERWAVSQSLLTHRAPIALAACAALANAVALCLNDTPLEAVFSSMIRRAHCYDLGTAELIERAVIDARSGRPPVDVLQNLQGWAAHECIAAATYICARHPQSLRDALLEAANTPGDSDSIATLVGAIMGARLGVEALPSVWIAEVERSTELLNLANEVRVALMSSSAGDTDG